MTKRTGIICLAMALLTILGCSSHRTFIERRPTEYGKIKFYFQTYENAASDYRHLVATIKNIRYDFRRDQIIKQTGEEKGIFYELYFGQMPIKGEKETLTGILRARTSVNSRFTARHQVFALPKI